MVLPAFILPLILIGSTGATVGASLYQAQKEEELKEAIEKAYPTAQEYDWKKVALIVVIIGIVLVLVISL